MTLTFLSLTDWYAKCNDLGLNVIKQGAEYEAFLDDKLVGTFYLYHNLGHIDCD
jgi:hypothetical protein